MTSSQVKVILGHVVIHTRSTCKFCSWALPYMLLCQIFTHKTKLILKHFMNDANQRTIENREMLKSSRMAWKRPFDIQRGKPSSYFFKVSPYNSVHFSLSIVLLHEFRFLAKTNKKTNKIERLFSIYKILQNPISEIAVQYCPSICTFQWNPTGYPLNPYSWWLRVPLFLRSWSANLIMEEVHKVWWRYLPSFNVIEI